MSNEENKTSVRDKKKVTKEEFDAFIASYPNELDRDVEPPLVNYNDFSSGKTWPDSIVAFFHWEDDESKREYYIFEHPQLIQK